MQDRAIGIIYVITNDINDKVYVGQTFQQLNARWKQHLDFALNRKQDMKIHKAIREIGASHFSISELEHGQFQAKELFELELYHIVKLNQIENGYNSKLPMAPEGDKLPSMQIKEINSLVNDYMSGKSIIDLAVKYNIARGQVSFLLKGYNREAKSSGEVQNSPKAVVMYDTYFNPIKIHTSVMAAVKYIAQIYSKDDLDIRNGYSNIKQSALKGSQYLGYRWQYLDTLYFDNKVFRTIFDIENYKTARYKTAVIHTTVLGDIYICGDLADSVKMGAHRKFRFTGCKIVDNEGNVTVKQSKDEQYKINRKANNANKPAKQNKLDIYRESPWRLVVDLREHGSYSAVARLRGCQPNALKKLALQLGYDIHYVSMLNDQEYTRLVNEIKVRSEA